MSMEKTPEAGWRTRWFGRSFLLGSATREFDTRAQRDRACQRHDRWSVEVPKEKK